jgi:ABC-type multidrug transport system ATPase subunit
MTFNGNSNLPSSQQAYVMQQDCLIPSLTVRETLRYSAELRLPDASSKPRRHEVVEEVILDLGLKDCAATRIGDSSTKGCSGGMSKTALIKKLLIL